MCDALPRLKHIAKVGMSIRDKSFNCRARVIGRVVIDDDDFVAHTAGVLAKQTVQRHSQHFRSVIGGYDSRYVEMFAHPAEVTSDVGDKGSEQASDYPRGFQERSTSKPIDTVRSRWRRSLILHPRRSHY